MVYGFNAMLRGFVTSLLLLNSALRGQRGERTLTTYAYPSGVFEFNVIGVQPFRVGL